MTGAFAPYSTRNTVLYNYPTLERLEDWHQLHGEHFTPGHWHYAGRPVGA